jgi:hypothetical protein
MRREHINALSLEAVRHNQDDADALWQDIMFLHSSPIRVMFELYQRDNYSAASCAGKKLMCGLLLCMESNKSVEDIHQPIRMEAKANQNVKLSCEHIQDIINHSGTLEARNVSHRAMVTKDLPLDADSVVF